MEPPLFTTHRKQIFQSFPKYLVFFTFALLTLGRNTINYCAVLTSPTKLNLKSSSGIGSTFCKTRLLPDHKTKRLHHLHLKYHSGCYLRAWHHQAWEDWSHCSFSPCFDVCQCIRCLQAPLFWQADPPNGLVLYTVTPRTAIIWAGVRLIFFLFMIVLWSCRVEITADLCLDATPRELACISMSPMKRYIWILRDVSSGTFDLISIEKPL